MSIELHNLRSHPKARQTTKRRGRGNASGAGTYSGKGQKGQRARSGGRKRIIQRGVKHFIMRMPKARGFYRPGSDTTAVALDRLSKFPANSVVSAETLKKHGLIKSSAVKIIGSGGVSKPLQFKVQAITAGARQAVEAAGGKVEIVINKKLQKKKSK